MKLKDLFENESAKPELATWTYADLYPDDAKRPVVEHSINIMNRRLTSLKGAPRYVQGMFNCSDNHLTSLEGAPEVVDAGFKCDGNYFTSFKGGPKKVGGGFVCNNSLGIIKSVEGLPATIGGRLHINYCKLMSLHNIHKYVKSIGGGSAEFLRHQNSPLKPPTHVLGLLLINGLKHVSFAQVTRFTDDDIDPNDVGAKLGEIINKHLAGDRDVIDCQNELIDAGLDEYAQL